MTTSRTGSGVVVEFAGLPGSGKSTIAACTRAALAERGVPCRIVDAAVSATVPAVTRGRRRAVLGAAELVAHPAAAGRATRAVRSSGQESLRDGIACLVQWLVVQRLIAQARGPSGVHLLQEGPVQTLWTLCLRSHAVATGGISALLSGLPADGSDLLVVVDAPFAEVSARLESRASRHSRTQALPEPARSAELRRGSLLLKEIVRHGAGQHQLHLCNDGSTTPEALGRQAADWLFTALGDPSGALRR